MSFYTRTEAAPGAVTRRLQVNPWGHFEPTSDDSQDLGHASYRWRDIYAGNATINTSDVNAKKDITDSALGTAFIRALRPVEYRWKDVQHEVLIENGVSGNPDVYETQTVTHTRLHSGFIAQEVLTVLDNLGIDHGMYIDPNRNGVTGAQTGLRYVEFIAPLCKAVQELDARLTALEQALS